MQCDAVQLAATSVPPTLPSPGGIVLRRRVLFLGPCALESAVNEAARAWVKRLSVVLTMDLDCQVAEPPYSTEDLDCRGYWFNPVARSDEARVKTLRKQAFAGLSSMLQHIARWKPDMIVGLGQGGLIAALASLPLVVEAACRARVTSMESMREYRESWSRVRAIVVINPLVIPQRSDIDFVKKALPEASRLQPATGPREIIISKEYQHGAFARALGGMIAAPVSREIFEPSRLKGFLARRPPVLIETGDGSGLCCVSGKKGALGRCPLCGLLMHHGCVQPTLPGRPQPCPVCEAEASPEGPPTDGYPHEMEVGAPCRRNLKPLAFVGVDAGQRAEAPLEGSSFPTNEEARQQGYKDAADWYCRAMAPSLKGTPALGVEVAQAACNAAAQPEEPEAEFEHDLPEVDDVCCIQGEAQTGREKKRAELSPTLPTRNRAESPSLW